MSQFLTGTSTAYLRANGRCNNMEEMLLLYLLSPKGYEQLASVVAAPTEEIARAKYSSIPEVEELCDMGVPILSLNITRGLAVQGYNVQVFKSGMFH